MFLIRDIDQEIPGLHLTYPACYIADAHRATFPPVYPEALVDQALQMRAQVAVAVDAPGSDSSHD